MSDNQRPSVTTALASYDQDRGVSLHMARREAHHLYRLVVADNVSRCVDGNDLERVLNYLRSSPVVWPTNEVKS